MKFPKFQNILSSSNSPNPQILQSPNLPISQSSNPPILSQSPLLLVSRSSRLLLSLSLFLLLSTGLFAQNEANVWYFSEYCGLDFNSGAPVILDDSLAFDMYSGSTISDSLGNFIFCSDGYYIYTKNGIIENGVVMIQPGYAGAAIVKWPGQAGVYYLFTAVMPQTPDRGFYYSIIDMKENNGLGAVTEKNIWIEAGWDVSDRIATVKKDNSESVWVIVKKNIYDGIAAFLVDENGFHQTPVFSETPDRQPDPYWVSVDGQIKISPNKKYLISKLGAEAEVCRFHADNGKVEYMYLLTGVIPAPDYGIDGIEFSPDSKFLYVACENSMNPNEIYQFDMQFITDSALFKNSAMLVGSGRAAEMQLARDGKIYCTPGLELPEIYWRDISVIHRPWIRGAGCVFEYGVLNMFPNRVTALTFPKFLVDYLYRFEWTGEPCQGYPIHFKPNFIPTPDSIVWNFDDQLAPGSLTDELSPTYAFHHPGVHEVKVDVWYPSGRYEHTSREIEIKPSPQPNLGPDTLICNGATLIINANCQADFFYWSNGQFGVSSITVSDSGTYWVRGKFSESGCEGYDTIHVGFHSPTLIDETNLEIIPTT